MLESVSKWVLDRSTTPTSRILACGIVGALVVIPLAWKKPELHIAWWQASFGGSLLGMTGGTVLTLFDLGADPARSRTQRWLFKAGAFAAGFVLLIALMIVIHLEFET